jgi:hypothetical protein
MHASNKQTITQTTTSNKNTKQNQQQRNTQMHGSQTSELESMRHMHEYATHARA